MKLSLCITFYDQDVHFLPSLLKEFERQTVKADEIIIVGNGLRENLNFDKAVLFEDRQMQSVSRNDGINVFTGDAIMFFDVDDIPHPQKIEITKKALENNIDAFVHNYNVNNSFFEKYNDCGFVDGHFTNSESCTNIVHSLNFPVHHSHIAVKRYCLEKVRFNESKKFYRSEDGKFCQDLISNGFDIGYSSHKLVNYRTR